MAGMPAPIVELLTELDRRGVELRACGEKLRYRPRSALTPELAQRVKAYKPELLAMLAGGSVGSGVAERGTPPHEPARVTEDPDNVRVRPDGSSVPHELSLAERVEAGYVNPGWPRGFGSSPTGAKRSTRSARRCTVVGRRTC